MKKIFYKVLNFIFAAANKVIEFTVKYPFLIAIIIIAVIFAIIVLLIRKNTNVGGFLSKLFSFVQTGNPIDLANSIPTDREEALGQADSRGFVQYKVEELERSSNPFRDRTTIVLPNGKRIKLPKGISDTEIDTVIQSEIEVIVIPNKDAYQRALKIQATIKKAKSTNSGARDLLERLKAKDA